MTERQGILISMGNTPLVPLTKLSPNPDVELWAKLESKNPGGSVKDRIALAMIEAAEASGELTPDKIILEATSGNTGIGLATVAAVKGYRVLLAMSEAVSVERRRILAALGAEFLLTPAEFGTDGAIEAVYEKAREEPERFFMPDQFNNPENWKAHYNTTAPEILEQSRGRVTHVVASMGTTGTVMGLSRFMREHAPTVRVIGAEPYLGHKIQGLKNLKEAYRPGIFELSALDGLVSALRSCYQPSGQDLAAQVADLETGFRRAMDDDLSVSAALAELFRFVRRVNSIRARDDISVSGAGRALEALERIDAVLAILPPVEQPLDAASAELIEQREAAREAGDFDLADELRRKLADRGILVEDTKNATRWRRVH